MPKFIQSALSVGIGTLLYELVVHGLHQAKWSRVAFIVLLSLPVFWLYYRAKERQVVAKA
ncbi:hypothetical protein [Geothrix paludis]|uniref:hypothetical protein n=1 Tax=Geothrix paludis TaxID=2922722 RepID=UPI001FADD75B|nr:hypothetical protein [Geothrix paludis]